MHSGVEVLAGVCGTCCSSPFSQLGRLWWLQKSELNCMGVPGSGTHLGWQGTCALHLQGWAPAGPAQGSEPGSCWEVVRQKKWDAATWQCCSGRLPLGGSRLWPGYRQVEKGE